MPCYSQRLSNKVQSTSATVRSLTSSENSSYFGANSLQWPHHGAKYFTKVGFDWIVSLKVSFVKFNTY